MLDYQNKVAEAVAFIKKKIPERPFVGLLTGTGLGDCAQSLVVSVSLPYSDIPHFPVSTVQSHAGKFLAGRLANRPAIVMQGRCHLYEGYSPLEVTFPVRVMQVLGVKILIVTNAAGGLNPLFKRGDIMIIEDHINLTGANPLVGPNHDDWGERFPDMTEAYDAHLISLAAGAGIEAAIPLGTGVYAGLLGPSLESPAEVRFLKTIGAEAVGFSTVLEVISAVHGRIRVLGLSIVTNIHDPDHPEPASVEEIINTAQAAAPAVDRIIHSVVGKI
jgi:purine-nucleoside phosphorylase